MSHEHKIFPVPEAFKAETRVNADKYAAMQNGALSQPDVFWAVQAKRLSWIKRPTKIKNASFDGDVSIKWYEDGTLNACYNCLDRHLENHGEKTAFIFEADEPGHSKHISYNDVHKQVCQLTNAMLEMGVQKGDRVTIYMPMIPEAAYAMLACARIGAVHSVVFGGFSPQSLRDRIEDCESRFVITADEGVRGGKTIPLKANVDAALKNGPKVDHVLVLKHTGNPVFWDGDRDVWWHDAVSGQDTTAPIAEMAAEDPLFILYTSGSTGKPKGVLHTTGGYLVYTSLTHEVTFDLKDNDIYWCTADVGWITGHSYIVYGPMCNAATQVLFEGVPNYPDYSRFWQVVEKHKVSLFYTAPTAIRALLREGDSYVTKTDRSSLRVLGSVGEPINSEAWLWYHDVIGEGRCPIVDTWWQTETGGHMITPLPGAHDLKPGAASFPFFGIVPQIVKPETGEVLEGEAEGALVIAESWPGQMRTVYKDHERFIQTYFSTYKGKYFTGDGAKRDADGTYWITGRMDDVVNVSGHRLGTAEIESAINEHDKVAESAVVGFPHDIKGQGIYAYVTLNDGETGSDTLEKEINGILREIIGPIAKADLIQFTDALPKTRSGKIMRRILRKIAAGEADQLGDISTLADPSVVDSLIKGAKSL
ncbi:MAG: acetate--CoA ligase [Pseudobdellovibrionaceae bacterium]